MRVVGVDFGLRRIGLALGELELGVATPRAGIAASGALARDAAAIADFARREGAEAVAVGVPVLEAAADGGRMQRLCREVGAKLEACGLRVFLVDEAFTSVEAEASLLSAGISRAGRAKRRDGEAAALILDRLFREEHGPV